MTRRNRAGEFPFVPRIINPVKIKRAIFLASDRDLRESGNVFKENLPWVQVEVLSDPSAVLKAAADETSVVLADDTGFVFLDAERIRARNKNAVLVLLSYQPFIHCSPPQAARQKFPYTSKADLIFAVNRDEFAPRNILPSVVRAAEDFLNIEKYADARRFIFHIVDDEPRWFSQFLPVLYGIIGQRADVRITRTYEESLKFLFGVEDESRIEPKAYLNRGHGDDVVCLIADIFFPKGPDLQSKAGQDLIRLVNAFYPRIPIIIASKAKEAHDLHDAGFVLPKGDPGSLQKLKEVILNLTGLGDFLIYDDEGRELFRAKDLPGIFQILSKAGKNTPEGRGLERILEAYGDKDKFSTWLYMHSYRELADHLRPKRSRGRRLVALLNKRLTIEIARMEKTALIMDGRKIFDLRDLQAALQTADAETIQRFSDNDVVSSWLDRKGYSELAEELRPIHGSGPHLRQTLLQMIEPWMTTGRNRRRTGQAADRT